MERKIGRPGVGISIFAPEAYAEYVRCFTPKTIRASCADYRATATLDRAMDEADWGRKVACPTLVLYGRDSHTGRVYGDVLAIWRDYAEPVTGGPLDCGHYVPEHAPAETLARFLQFFGRSAEAALI